MGPEGKKLMNIIVLGVGFMFIFTAFQTCGNIEQTVIKSFNSTTFHASGYTSMAIIYGVFSASNLLAPSVVAVAGTHLSMFFSGLLYSAYIAVFVYPYTWSFYAASALVGVGAAVLWTAQGSVLALNSDRRTIGRNSGVFWALLQCSLLFGNTFIFLAWRGHERISVQACKMFVTKEMSLLSLSIAYTGVELTFYSGVYGTCIGATSGLGPDAKSLIGLSGICVGLGEIVGGAAFGMLNKCSGRLGRNPVVLLGLLAHYLAFYLIFINIADDAPLAPDEGTQLAAFIRPSVGVALLCSFLLGLGDSCFNTQLLSIIGSIFRDNSAPAFAVFKFIQSVLAALAFFYSNFLPLRWQLLIMVALGFAGSLSFMAAERRAQAGGREGGARYDGI